MNVAGVRSRFLAQAGMVLAAALASTALAAEPVLRVALGETKPPYVMADHHAGVEYSIVTEILAAAGYRYTVAFVPNKRAQLMLAEGEIDAAISLGGAYLSEPYIAYKNMAITLCSRKIALSQTSDLARYRVAAFQNAHLFLGDAFADAAANNPDYREISPQIGIDRLLYSGRIDVAVSDINIFKYFSHQLGARFDTGQALCAYPLFPPTLYRLSFREGKARDRFNIALKAALKGNLYEEIARRYDVSSNNGEPYFKPPAADQSNMQRPRPSRPQHQH